MVNIYKCKTQQEYHVHMNVSLAVAMLNNIVQFFVPLSSLLKGSYMESLKSVHLSVIPVQFHGQV